MPMMGPRHTVSARDLWIGLFTILIVFTSLAGVAVAQYKVPVLIQFSIEDKNGNFYHKGEIEFCTPDGDCVFGTIEPGFPGHFRLPSARLKPDTPYTIFVYDDAMTVLYEMRNWVFVPGDYDPDWDYGNKVEKFLVFPRFQAHQDRQLTFSIETTLNPEWQRLSDLNFVAGPPKEHSGYPEFMGAFHLPYMLGGKFGTDEFAAGGVSKMKLGWGLAGYWRTDYPMHQIEREGWVSFRELGLTYAQNRYETLSVMTPGRRGDVTFHRVTVSYGLGMMNQTMTSQWSVSAALSAGGLYDGGELLKYLDRTYLLYGGGVQVRGIHGVFKTGRVDVGVVGQVDLIYYLGDEGLNDFWYGLAPSLSIGVVIF